MCRPMHPTHVAPNDADDRAFGHTAAIKATNLPAALVQSLCGASIRPQLPASAPTRQGDGGSLCASAESDKSGETLRIGEDYNHVAEALSDIHVASEESSGAKVRARS